jgi:hypothetical protein
MPIALIKGGRTKRVCLIAYKTSLAIKVPPYIRALHPYLEPRAFVYA